MSEIKPLG